MSTQTPRDDLLDASRQPARVRSHAPILVLLIANGISMIGNQLTLVAVPWFVLQTTGSALETGITAFSEAAGAVVAAFLGGVLVDYLGFKRSSVIADVASGIAIACVPLLYISVGLAFWQLLILVFLSNFCNIPGETARSALLPELADLAGMRIERASAALQTIERGSRLIGAPLAGLFIALLGASQVLWLDAITFLLSALMVGFAIPFSRLHTVHTEERSRVSFMMLFDGIRVIARNRLVLAIVLIVMIMNFVDTPFRGVMLPVYITRTSGNPFVLGLLIAISGGGAVIGALLFAAIGHKLSRWGLFFGGLLVITLRYWVFCILPPLAVIVVAQTLVGIASGPINPIINTITYERIPAHLRGRALGTIEAGVSLAVPMGMLLAGYLLSGLGLRLTLAAAATCYLGITTCMLLVPALREMNAPKREDA